MAKKSVPQTAAVEYKPEPSVNFCMDKLPDNLPDVEEKVKIVVEGVLTRKSVNEYSKKEKHGDFGVRISKVTVEK